MPPLPHITFCKSILFILLAMITFGSASAMAQVDASAKKMPPAKSVQFLLARIKKHPFEAGTRRSSIYYLLQIAERLEKINKPELAQSIFRRAELISQADTNSDHFYSLFETSLKLSGLKIAERLIEELSTDQDKARDRLDLEKFCRGDEQALENGYPRFKMEFWSANRHGQALVRAGKFKLADQFIRELDIAHEENDPRTVGVWVYSEIASLYRDKGDMENARKYIDKAWELGGTLYYTGYGLKVRHRSMHGALTKDLDLLARQGAAYRGHMGRELLHLLVSELRETGHFSEAIQCTKHFEEDNERLDALARIAVAQAKANQIPAALSTLQLLAENKNVELATRFQMASVTKDAERRAEILSNAHQELAELPWNNDTKPTFSAAGAAMILMQQFDEFDQLFERYGSVDGKSVLLFQAFSALID